MILSSLSIRRFIVFLGLLFVSKVYACDVYNVSHVDEEVVAKIFNKDCRLIFEQSTDVEPNIEVYDPFVKYTISLGIYVSYTTFIDRNISKITKPFYSVFSYNFSNKMVLHNKENKLFLSSMFGDSGIEIKRNFSESATLSSVIIDSRIDEEYIHLNYLRGDYEEYSEKIALKSLSP